MNDFKSRFRSLVDELVRIQLYKDWPEYLITLGIDENEAHTWGVEIGEIVYEYERNLRFLIDMLLVDNSEQAIEKLNDWTAYTRDMTIWKLQDIVQELQRRYEKYLPPKDEDENDE